MERSILLDILIGLQAAALITFGFAFLWVHVLAPLGRWAKEKTAPMGRRRRRGGRTVTGARPPPQKWREHRERRSPVLPAGVRLTRRVREEYRAYSDRNATMRAA